MRLCLIIICPMARQGIFFHLPFDPAVIVLTATYDVNLAVALMKLGVDDFLVKDKDMQFIKLHQKVIFLLTFILLLE